MRTLYFRPVVSSFLPHLISAVADWLSTVLLQMVWLVLVRIYNAGLKCAARDSLEIQDAKMTQNITICTASHSHKLSGCIFATKTDIDNQKKCVKQQHLLHMFPQYGELRPSNGWDQFGSLAHPSKFQWVSHLAFVTRLTAATSLTTDQPNFARCLAVSLAATLYVHFRGLLPPDGILPSAKFTYLLYVQVLRSPTLAALLHGNPAAGVSQTLQHGTKNGITELSQRAPPIFGWLCFVVTSFLLSSFFLA